MQVPKQDVVALLTDLGVYGSAGWGKPEFADKLNKRGGVTRYQETPNSPIKLAPAKASLFAKLADAYNQNDPIEVTEAARARAAPVARTPRTVGRAKAKPGRRVKRHYKPVDELAVWSRDDLSWAEKRKLWRDKPARLYADGVIVAIIRQLRAAGIEKKPVTKAQILDALKVQFPTRSADQMWQTINNQVPSQLREQRGLFVTSQTIGQGATRAYWIPWNQKTDEAAREKLGFDFDDAPKKSKKSGKRGRP